MQAKFDGKKDLHGIENDLRFFEAGEFQKLEKLETSTTTNQNLGTFEKMNRGEAIGKLALVQPDGDASEDDVKAANPGMSLVSYDSIYVSSSEVKVAVFRRQP